MKQLTDIISKPMGALGELIALKLFGKSTTRIKAELENERKRIEQIGDMQRELQAPFLFKMEQQKVERQFGNLFTTLAQTQPLISDEQEKPIADDNDFFWGMIEHAKDVSNDDIQSLIAKILAGEYNQPGSYSISTLQVIKSLGKSELLLFEEICGYMLDEGRIPFDIFTAGNNVGLSFANFQTLQSLGLILPQPMVSNYSSLSLKEGALIFFSYFNKQLRFTVEQPHVSVSPQFYGLTPAGEQISKHLKVKEVDGFFEWLKKNFRIQGCRLLEDGERGTSQILYKG